MIKLINNKYLAWLMLCTLSLLDLLLTYININSPQQELNPIMQYFIAYGWGYALLFKLITLGFGLILNIRHLIILISIYSAVIIYHLALITLQVPTI